MNILLTIPLVLLYSSWDLIREFIWKALDHAKLVIHLLEVEVNFLVELLLRSISFFPSLNSKVDRTLSRLGFAALCQFYPEYHPKLFRIEEGIRRYLQDKDADLQIIDAYFLVLLRLHHHDPDTFPNLTTDDIRQRFTNNWPSMRPLSKSSCLTLEPTTICWGMVDRRISEPILWINPYLVQALEAAKEVSGDKYPLYTS